MNDKYILHEKTPIIEHDLIKWAEWFETADRIVKQDKIGNTIISTVFLGLDHSFGGHEPLLFETMIFNRIHDDYQERYSSWDEAEIGHQKALLLVRKK